MLHEKLVRSDERDVLPGAAVEEAVRLASSDLQIDGFRAERLPFGVGGVPAFLPRIFVAEEGDGGWEIGLQMAQDVDLGVFVVIGGERGVEPQIGDNAGIDILRVRRVVEAGIHRGEGADVAACAAATGDNSLRVDAEFTCVLFEPTNRAFRIGDADALAGFACGQLSGIGLAEHLILRRGTDEPTTGEVGAGDTKLAQRAAAPSAAVEEDHTGHFRLRSIVVWRKVDLHLALHASRGLVDVRFASGSFGTDATFGFLNGLFSGNRCTTKGAEEQCEAFHISEE